MLLYLLGEVLSCKFSIPPHTAASVLTMTLRVARAIGLSATSGIVHDDDIVVADSALRSDGYVPLGSAGRRGPAAGRHWIVLGRYVIAS